jgi:hypothetical protein
MPVSLTAGQIEATTVGGVGVDTANAAVAANFSTDFGGSVQLVIAKGTPASNAFGGSPRTSAIVATLNLSSGAWSATNGTSGTLSGAALTNFKNNTLTPLRNQLETFVLNNVLPGGSQVSWT